MQNKKSGPAERGHTTNHGKISGHVHSFENAILGWKAPEYTRHEKSALWFVIAAAVAIGLVIYGLATDGWSFSLAIIVFCGTYYLIHRKTPPIVEVKISKIGVKIGRHLFSYSGLEGFWIAYDPPFLKRLYLKMEAKFKPDVFVSIEDTDPVEVRKILLGHTNEISGKHEPFADTLVRLLGL
ncbi:hypothetical protein HZA42_00945 [Candidatus Peregrinibacteria bacterium]|nr:hypothetical protein [Candidatus Peregrinibacteria bacterium]